MPTTPANPDTNQTPDTVRMPDGEGVENTSSGTERQQPAPQEIPFENDTPQEIPAKAG